MIGVSLPVEARILAEMLTNPDALALCDAVESADFVDMRHVVVFHGIRDVQEQALPVTVDTVVEAIQQRAISCGSPAMAEKVGYEFIGDLITRAPKADNLGTVKRDAMRLRQNRDLRERLVGAA